MSAQVHTPITPGLVVPAPTTGVHLGRTRAGAMTLRLFRPSGTRIVAISMPFAAELVALRAAVAGATVRVVTSRPASWTTTLQYGADAQLVAAEAPLPRGPLLAVNDRPEEVRALDDVTDWRCLLDIRELRPDLALEWNASYLATFAHADVMLFGVLSPDLANAAGRVFGLGDDAAALTVVPPNSVAVVTRGKLELVRIDATAPELQALRRG